MFPGLGWACRQTSLFPLPSQPLLTLGAAPIALNGTVPALPHSFLAKLSGDHGISAAAQLPCESTLLQAGPSADSRSGVRRRHNGRGITPGPGHESLGYKGLGLFLKLILDMLYSSSFTLTVGTQGAFSGNAALGTGWTKALIAPLSWDSSRWLSS